MIFDGMGEEFACAPRLPFEMPSLGEMPMLPPGLNAGDFASCVNCISGTAFGCTCSFNADLRVGAVAIVIVERLVDDR